MEIDYPTTAGFYWTRRSTSSTWDFLTLVYGTTPYLEIKVAYRINESIPVPSDTLLLANDGTYKFVAIDEPVIA